MTNKTIPKAQRTTEPGLSLYLCFVVSWFLHLGERIPFLGVIRFDLLLLVVLTYIAVASRNQKADQATDTDKMLRILVGFAIVTIPFVEWPGSVINSGIPNFIKGVVFYYFTVSFIRSGADIRKFLFVFIACQLFRVLEPLYLHVTEDYWGSVAYMLQGSEFLERLSGAPSDVVNPNGLAFIICTILPFLFFLSGRTWTSRLPWLVFGPACLYALALTGSRSGMIGLVVVFAGIIYYSKRRVAWLLSLILLVTVTFPLLSSDMQDRYLSVIGRGEKNEGTAEGRLTGIQANFEVALRRPLFGHGLGTTREANANFGTSDQPAHNLYAEVAQELGFVGLVLWLVTMWTIASGFIKCGRAYQGLEESHYLSKVVKAMTVCLAMNVIFSFASYGLSSYEWYLLGGFSVVLRRLSPTLRRAPTSRGANHPKSKPLGKIPNTGDST